MSAEALADMPVDEPDPLAPREHPSPEHLENFMRGRLSAEERGAVIRHLLAGCRQCRYITGRIWSLGEEKALPVQTLLKEKVRMHRRQMREQVTAKPPRGGIAVAALVNAARGILLDNAQELAAIYSRLEGLAAALEGPPMKRPEAEDVAEEMRVVVRSVLQECLRSAIGDLRSAAYYPEEPPSEEDSWEEGPPEEDAEVPSQ